MIELIASAVLIILFLVTIWDIKKAVYFYIPVSFFYDLFSILYERGSVNAMIRGGIVLYIIGYTLLKYPKVLLKLKEPFIIVAGFLFILGLNCFFSDNPVKSFTEYLKTVIILLMYFVGYIFFYRGFDISKLLGYTRFVLVFLVFNVLISNFAQFGFAGYNETGFYSGSLIANNWYAPTLAAIITFLLISSAPRNLVRIQNKNLWKIFVGVSFLLILLSGRRSAVAILGISIVLYLMLYPNRLEAIKRMSFLVFIFLLLIPFYNDIIKSQYKDRMNLFSQEGLETENRYRETNALWDEVLSFQNIKTSLIGRNPFYTVGQYGSEDEFNENRYLHVDINIIVFSSGFIGLFLYALFYFQIFRMAFPYFKVLRKRKGIEYYYLIIFYTIFFSLILISFSGGFNAITFRSMSFLILGAITGSIHKKVENVEKDYLLV